MRILHVYSGNLFGGIERILVTLASSRHLEPGLEHEFALCFKGRLSRELAAARVAIRDLAPARLSRPHTVALARRALGEILESVEYEAVICHGPWSYGLFGTLVRRMGRRLVFWVHDALSGAHWTERLSGRIVPDLAICNSQYTAGTLPAVFPGLVPIVLYAPVPMAAAPIGADERARIRNSFQTDLEAFVIVQASRAEAWKGHDVLADALSLLGDRSDWVWWIVGGAQRPAEAAFLSALRDRATRTGILPRIRWIGERDDVPRVVAAADVYCQANLSPEPFGIVFVEALAAGVPVVATRLGGPSEIVTDECGLLVDPCDSPGLASALARLMDDPALRRRLAGAGPARACALCDPARQIAALHHRLATLTPSRVGA